MKEHEEEMKKRIERGDMGMKVLVDEIESGEVRVPAMKKVDKRRRRDKWLKRTPPSRFTIVL